MSKKPEKRKQRQPIPVELLEKMRHIHAETRSYKETAKQTGLSYGAIWKYTNNDPMGMEALRREKHEEYITKVYLARVDILEKLIKRLEEVKNIAPTELSKVLRDLDATTKNITYALQVNNINQPKVATKEELLAESFEVIAEHYGVSVGDLKKGLDELGKSI